MVVRNDYVLKTFNGDIGIVLPDVAGGVALALPDVDFGYRFVPLARMPAHETAYALTVHKAQGAEFQKVLTVLPVTPRALSRELLYTAVTRARSTGTLIATAGALEQAIERRSQSGSGLAARLRGHG
jgi:exodeoxyribonuclease V alpha subunit